MGVDMLQDSGIWRPLAPILRARGNGGHATHNTSRRHRYRHTHNTAQQSTSDNRAFITNPALHQIALKSMNNSTSGKVMYVDTTYHLNILRMPVPLGWVTYSNKLFSIVSSCPTFILA